MGSCVEGAPIGSGAIERSNKSFVMCAEALWGMVVRADGNEMLALRCAKYNGTFDWYSSVIDSDCESVRITECSS